MRTYYLTVSVGQKSKHGVAEFSAQGYTGCNQSYNQVSITRSFSSEPQCLHQAY